MSQAPRALVALALSPVALLAAGVAFAAESPGHYESSGSHAASAHVVHVGAAPSVPRPR
jgi:hypothetical protein